MHRVVLELEGDHQLARDLVAGGVFVPGCTLALNEECELVVRARSGEVVVAARVVWHDAQRGAGLQLMCSAAERQRIGELAGMSAAATATAAAATATDAAAAPDADAAAAAAADAADAAAAAAADDDDADPESRKIPLNVHERLRGLNLAQQIKLAHSGETAERIVLERLYGKNVWEALLRNPRITGPEVARMARMGSLPRPLVEVIVGNGAWLQVPEVRRALLSNPRLAPDQVLRVLRLLPKHELKLVPAQTAYPFPVRDAARRILRDG